MVYTVRNLLDACVLKRGRMKHRDMDKRKAYEELWNALNEWMETVFKTQKVRIFLKTIETRVILENSPRFFSDSLRRRIFCFLFLGISRTSISGMELGVLSHFHGRYRKRTIQNENSPLLQN